MKTTERQKIHESGFPAVATQRFPALTPPEALQEVPKGHQQVTDRSQRFMSTSNEEEIAGEGCKQEEESTEKKRQK